MLIWMLYATLVAALLAAGAHLGDAWLRAASLPRRGLWFLVLAGALALPWILPGVSTSPLDTAVAVGDPTVQAAPAPPAVPASRTPLQRLTRLDGAARLAWITLSALLLVRLVVSALRLHARLGRWPLETRDGLRIRRGAALGPAVVGVVRPTVVLPAWVDGADEADARLILDHERQHVRARDNLVVLAAYLGVVAMAFNPFAWVLFRRLREAVEEDCDRRVLAGRGWPEQRRYGELLIHVGHRVGTGTRAPTPAAFAESGLHLERRIRTMYQLDPRPTTRRLALSLTGGALLFAGACMVPGPDAPSLTEPEVVETVEPTSPVGDGAVADGPDFTPYTRAPDLVNREEVARAVEAEYPPVLREAGIGGQVRVWLYIDETGAVTDLRLDESSGHQALDAAAMRVAGEMEFAPALNRDEPVAVWIAMPIAFGRPVEHDDVTVTPRDGPPSPPVDRAELEREPTFTPYTVAPDLVNRAEVGQALQENYPAELRDAGIGGTARVWFFIDETGAVADTRIQESSGHEAIDWAALRVARTMEFTPALNREETVPVWVAFPITFQVR